MADDKFTISRKFCALKVVCSWLKSKDGGLQNVFYCARNNYQFENF